MARTLMVMALLLGLLVVPPVASHAAVLYAADGATGHLSSLVILNPDTGAVASVVGPIGFAVTGLAVHPQTGVLHGSTANLDPTAPGSLITVDKTTGAGTLVGSYGLAEGTLPDLTFSPDGTLYGWAQPLNALHRVDTATGLATRVGNFDFGPNIPGLGIAATTDALILAGGGRGQLFRVDRNTGVALPFTTLDWHRLQSAIAALTFGPGGVLFGIGSAGLGSVDGSFLVRIDTDIGHVTELGPTIALADALAFDPPTFAESPPAAVPTLSELGVAVMGLLLAGVATYRIRHRRPSAA